MATRKKKPTKPGKRVAGKVDKIKKKPNTYTVKDHRYSVTFATGSPAFYDTPEQMRKEADDYFIYILGEWVMKEVVVTIKGRKKKVMQEVCIRNPEPATVTGLCLYLGFASLQSLDDYSKKGREFADIIKRAKLRVENRYEQNLSGEKPTGSIFALKNMGWKDSNFLGEDGAVAGILAWNYITPPKPKDDDEE